MRDFSVGRALGLMLRTWPFVLLRVAVYFGAALAYVLVTGAGAGIGWGVGGFGDSGFRASATMWGGVIGFGLVATVMYLAREYVLYIVKAGHIAVLVKLLDGEPMPAGRPQVAHDRQEVTKRFAQASVLFGVDQLVRGVLRAITGLVRGIMGILPIPGARQVVVIVHAFLRIAVGFIDEGKRDADRMWRLADELDATFFGVAPTMIRAVLQQPQGTVEAHDLSRLRITASTGEPWMPEA